MSIQTKTMVSKERRKGPERRTDLRVGIDADVEWVLDGVRRPGHVSDMSMTGCFILTAGEFSDGEIVLICFPHADGGRVEIRGEIRNNVPEIGFAVRFLSPTPFQQEFIRDFAEFHYVHRE